MLHTYLKWESGLVAESVEGNLHEAPTAKELQYELPLTWDALLHYPIHTQSNSYVEPGRALRSENSAKM